MRQIKLVPNFKPRMYQETIFGSCINKNSLVVLPTGLGKTIIALLLTVYYFNKTNKKVLFMAPTKPLVEQQKRAFEEFFSNPTEFKFCVLTGLVSPKKRVALYKENDFLFSTPQLVENDLINKTISPEDFCFVVFDEAHRGTGNYSYGFVAQEFEKSGAKVLALSASPGISKEEVYEVINNLKIENLEVRSYEDSDVKEYANKTKLEKVTVKLPKEFLEIVGLLNKAYKKRVEELVQLEILDSSKKILTKKDLLDLQLELRTRINEEGSDERIWRGISVVAGLLKLAYGIELFESQEVSASHSYFNEFFRQNGDNTKAAQDLIRDLDFRDAFEKICGLKKLEVLHPKLIELKSIVSRSLLDNSDLRIIVFSQYRESGLKIVSELAKLKEIKPVLFVGQAKKGESGLSQKEQKEILQKFRDGEFNVLVSTSVGEEGLDIPKVDLVVFYEPLASAIRTIQRIGRTGRFEKGKAFVLQSEGTRDIVTGHIASAKEKKMYRTLEEIKVEFKKRLGNGEGELDKSKSGLSKFLNSGKDEGKGTEDTKIESTSLGEKFSIFVDSRENSDLVKVLFKMPDLEVRTQNLDVGDVVISQDIAIERKSKVDFVNSLIEKKLFRQVKDLAVNFRRPIVIVEGPENIYAVRNVEPGVIRASLSAIAIDFRVPIIFTSSILETAEFIRTITKRAFRDKKEFSLAGVKTANSESQEIEKVVSSIPKINVVTAKKLLGKFKSVKNLANAKVSDFLEIDGVGEFRAKTLKDFFEREWKEF